MDLNIFRMNKAGEVEGVWVDLDATSSVKIARANNRKAQAATSRLFRPHSQAQKAGTLSEDIVDKIMVQIIAEAILIDWKGITEDGIEIEPTMENKVRILTTYREFRDIVFNYATDATNYRAAAIEADAQD